MKKRDYVLIWLITYIISGFLGPLFLGLFLSASYGAAFYFFYLKNDKIISFFNKGVEKSSPATGVVKEYKLIERRERSGDRYVTRYYDVFLVSYTLPNEYFPKTTKLTRGNLGGQTYEKGDEITVYIGEKGGVSLTSYEEHLEGMRILGLFIKYTVGVPFLFLSITGFAELIKTFF